MKRILTAILALLLCNHLWGGTLYEYRDSVKNGYNFLLYVPDSYTETSEPLPLIVCLHGKSRAGYDLHMITKYGCVDALRRGTKINALVICPQCPSAAGWIAEKVMNVVNFVGKRYSYDSNRLYVFGMSMGGWGTFKMVAEYPDKVAAAIAMCGGYTGSHIENMGKVPLWIIHGDSDDVTRPYFSKRIIEQLEASGNDKRLRSTWLEGQGHSILARIFLLQQTYDWLTEHSLTDPDRPCSREYEVTNNDLRRAYIYLDPENRQRLPFTKP